jgi:hypothetical protein
VAIPRSPETTLYNTPGTVTIPVPSWANVVQVPAVGGGGGGNVGGTWGVAGQGGFAGIWNFVSWVRGVHFSGTPSLSIVIPTRAIGGAGNNGGYGRNGGDVVVTLPATPGFSAQTLTATGGDGGAALTPGGVDSYGRSPGNQIYDGVTYVGGPEMQGTFGAPGTTPGGGASGGNWVSFQAGGPGGPGAAWIRFKQ